MKLLIRTAIITVYLVLVQAGTLIHVASAQGIKTGLLTCHVAGGFGWILGSTRTMDCQYSGGSGHTEEYSGTITKIGIDVGYLGSFVLVWAVVAPNSKPGPGALAGNYFGATAQAAAGLGGGVNVMTGGFRNSVALQPVSFEGNTGLYVGAGVSSMSLELTDY
jgi:hypothetical protein